jgi:trk system potassium uptake protein TrkH
VANDNSEKASTPRQLRRQQQREQNLLRPAPVLALDPPIKPPSEFLGPSVFVPLFCAMVVMGYLLYHTSGFAVKKGNELSNHQSVFTAVNAATLTGFQQLRNPDAYTPSGQYLTLLLMLGGSLFSLIGCGVAVIRIGRMRFTDLQLALWALGSIGVVVALGGLAMRGEHRTVLSAIFQTVSAFSNSGLTLGKLPAQDSIRSLLILLPLAVLGGLGIPVIMEVYDRLTGRAPLSLHSRVVLNWTAGAYVLCAVLLLFVHWPGYQASFFAWRYGLLQSSQLSLNARSAGLPFVSISALPQATTLILILVMIIGASSGGTAGGLKVTTLQVLSRGTVDTLAGRNAGRRFGIAIIWLLVYLGMLLLATVCLLLTEPDMKLDRTLFLAASALGNVGLSHEPVTTSTAGLYVLSATMILGRVAPMMMLWYILDTTPDARVAVG